ncbi:MAG: SRPBCC family protein [Bacteroidia bacterium]
MTATKITVEATTTASLQTAWDNYTKPEHITKWNFASDDWHCPSSEIDLRVGGKMRSRMEAKDGSFGFDFEAEYTEIIPLKKIVYKIADGREAATTFSEENGKTKVTTIFEAESVNSVDLQKGGWQAILNNYVKYCNEIRK